MAILARQTGWFHESLKQVHSHTFLLTHLWWAEGSKRSIKTDFLLSSFSFQECFQNMQICYHIFVPNNSAECLCCNIFNMMVIVSFRSSTFCNKRAEKYRLKKYNRSVRQEITWWWDSYNHKGRENIWNILKRSENKFTASFSASSPSDFNISWCNISLVLPFLPCNVCIPHNSLIGLFFYFLRNP